MPSLGDPSGWLKELFINAGLNPSVSSFLRTITLVFVVLLFSWFFNLIAKALIRNVVSRIVRRTTSTWDDIFLDQKVFTRLSHFAPAIIIWTMAGWALKDYPVWLSFVHKLTYIYMVAIATVVAISFINAWHEIYKTLPISQHRHIKGYVQLVKIFIYTISSLILFSVIFKKDISTIVAGLGAMAAVLILVFKDTILGFVASIQLSANEMLKVGDWITIPGRDVDGTVLDITLNTVKIQNFDRTIITVPTYALVNESFQNWKGMEQSKSRQVKRALLIDMKSIRFMDEDMRKRLSIHGPLKDYIERFEKQGKVLTPGDVLFNKGIPTNLALFRHYAETYIKSNPLIDQGQVVILRHRASDGNGLPLQVYFFTTGYQMVPYENLQSEVFEHLVAAMKEFGLKLFQHPTGYDVIASNTSLSEKFNNI
ncbi:MAG TPA: mechanosensitive ion channel domain-containing protein [Bacteroidales bacterium]|nr:mechanosensitive ion channel domain-containing protein [Bacteroidales bacterium]